MPRILIVEDNVSIAENLKARLEAEHYKVDTVYDGLIAQRQIMDPLYDLLILDWQLPGVSGIELCKTLRSRGSHVLVIMLTGRDTVDDKTSGLESGADDYLAKPFSMKELLARVKALLRRPPKMASARFVIGDIVVDIESRTVTRGGKEIHLQRMEFNVLEFFLKHPGLVIDPETLLLRVWDDDADASISAVYTCVTRLRKKLGMVAKDSPLQTLHGVGYTYVPPPAPEGDDEDR